LTAAAGARIGAPADPAQRGSTQIGGPGKSLETGRFPRRRSEYASAVDTDDHQLIGKVGRVTGAIDPGGMGEVMVPVRGGSESFYAYASDPAEEIPRGTRVVVLEHDPPRTVVVSRYP
jgi:hypothetical protein